MTVSGTLSSLLALLMLLACARAACPAAGRAPKITVAGPTVREWLSLYRADYGAPIELSCSFHDTEHLTIIRRVELSPKNDTHLPVVVLNATTITSVLQPTIGWYTYICVDNKSGCNRSLIIQHVPAIQVSSRRRVLHTVYGNDYFVPYGDDFQVICAGSEYKTLRIYTGYPRIELKTETVNDTAVAYRARADDKGKLYYRCRAQNYAYQELWLTVDYLPEAHNFSCISYDHGENIICSWRPSSEQTSFRLFYGSKNEERLCDGLSSSASSCVWKNKFMSQKLLRNSDKVYLVMQTCIDFICHTQTFTFPFKSVIKNSPVTELNVKNTGKHDAFMTWKDVCSSDYPCSYKIEYQLLAFREKWLQADTSSVQCYNYNCEFRLALPCPNLEYEVRVYYRYEEATDDRVWSDPVSVVTSPSAGYSCKAGNKEPSVPITPGEASCEACELREYVIETRKALHKLKSNLRMKRERLLHKIKIKDEIDSLSIKFYSL